MQQKAKDEYTAIRIKADTLEKIKDLKDTFEELYQNSFTLDEFINKMLQSVSCSHPDIWNIFLEKAEMKSAIRQRIADARNRITVQTSVTDDGREE